MEPDRHHNPRGSLPALCERLGDAIGHGDEQAVTAEEAAIERLLPTADLLELSVGVLWLTQTLSEMPARAGATELVKSSETFSCSGGL